MYNAHARTAAATRAGSRVALSRTAFIDRFTSLIGMPPIRYSTYWRLEAAKLQLREGRGTIAQIAYSVG
jgi:AraC-like DNA-binding protein